MQLCELLKSLVESCQLNFENWALVHATYFLQWLQLSVVRSFEFSATLSSEMIKLTNFCSLYTKSLIMTEWLLLHSSEPLSARYSSSIFITARRWHQSDSWPSYNSICFAFWSNSFFILAINFSWWVVELFSGTVNCSKCNNLCL